MTKEEFIKEVTDGLLPPPKYFPLNVKMNKEGYDDIDKIINNGTKPLNTKEFERIANQTNAVVLDVRNQNDFAKAHIPQSIFIGIDGNFAPWVGTLIGDVSQPILLITPEGREEETVTRLSRVGFDNTLGYLKGGIKVWRKDRKSIDSVEEVDANEFEKLIKEKKQLIFDVRKNIEYNIEHVANAMNTPLDFINIHMNKFSNKNTFYLHCAGGYRSMIAASILKSRGIHNFVDVSGGFNQIKKTKINIISED